ncbi:MAG: DUF2298 domain-containing protein, partial [Chloroflexi bacterium]|nr:DUF2298 domain-containing protein [Chloroflexota bacterium]
MLNAFWWLITTYAIGLVAFPFVYLLLPRLRDRGYSISKPFGILLLGYLSWILSSAHIVPNVRIGIVGLLIVLGSISVWVFWRRRSEILDFAKREWALILVTELIFLALFIGWTVYRAFDPSINHTEQPMDFMFLNASVRTVWAPPADPWLSGHSVSYYYFGFWLMGGITKLTGIQTSIAYNL